MKTRVVSNILSIIVDLFIWKSEVDIVGYYIIRINYLRRKEELHVILKSHYLVIISQVFVVTFKALL